MGKGENAERALVTELEEAGYYAAIRCPASGGGTNRDLPDLLAINSKQTLAIEAKSTLSSDRSKYIPEEEVEALCRWASDAGAIPLLGARLSVESGNGLYGSDELSKWRFSPPDMLYHTDSGSVRLRHYDMLENGATIEDVLDGELSKYDPRSKRTSNTSE